MMNKPKIRRFSLATDFIENSRLDLDCAMAFSRDFCCGEKRLTFWLIVVSSQ